jgi:hypothetical protein
MSDSELLKLIKEIKECLIENSFIKEDDFCNENVVTYDYKMSVQDLFRVSVFFDSDFISVDVNLVSINEKFRIAERYEVQNINEFLFLINRTSRSPLYKMT